MKLKIALTVKFRAWKITFFELNEVIDVPVTTIIPINEVLFSARGVTLRLYTVTWPS
jgi:hypothetical protein